MKQSKFQQCKKMTDELILVDHKPWWKFWDRQQRPTQQILPYRISENGIFELENKKGNHLFDKVYVFADVNFSIKDEDEKEEIFDLWCRILNSQNIPFKIVIANQNRNISRMKREMLLKKRGDKYDLFIEQYNHVILDKMDEGENSIEQVKYLVLSCEKPDYENAKSYFQMVETSLYLNYRKIGSTLIPLDAKERLRSLHAFYRLGKEDEFDFGWDLALNLRRDWRNDVCGIYIKEEKDHLEMENRECCTLFLQKFSQNLEDKFLTELTSVPFNTTTALDIIPVPSTAAWKIVEGIYMNIERAIQKQQDAHNKRNAFSSEVSYKKRREKEEVETYMDKMRSNDQKMFLLGLTVTITAQNMEMLHRHIDTIKNFASGYNMTFEIHTGKQMDAMLSTLPTAVRKIDTMRVLFTESTGIFMPFNVQELQHAKGIYYGINQVSKNILRGDRRCLKNGNGFVFGVPGSGKSFFVKFEMGQVYIMYMDADIIVVDPQNEYFEIAQFFDGQVINMSANTDNFVNPLWMPQRKQIRDTGAFIADKSEFMFGICEQALKPETLSATHVAVIDRCVREIYQEIFASKSKNMESPTMTDFRKKLYEQQDPEVLMEARHLYAALETFVEGSLNMFAHQSNVEVDNRFVVYGLRDLGDSLRAMAMLVMIENIRTKIAYNQKKGRTTWVYVDEFHTLLNDEYSQRALEKLWKEVRKQGGFCTGITQNIMDCLLNKRTKTMISNSEFTVLLDQSSLDQADILDVIEVSESQLEYVTNSDPGTGLQRFGDKIVTFDITVPDDNPIYKMFNTNFHERAANDIMKE